MRIAGKPIHRGPLVDRPRHVPQRAGRPADVLDFVPIETPWAPYPAQPGPMSAAMLSRGHQAGKDGRCRTCKAEKPRGGWDVPCPKRRD